jgi:hypothetical protein
LINLTEKNADIQKIVAFENAFERLFAILLEEGAVEGGIIVQDCLQLMHNLLRYNSSNQNLFRETSCIKMVPKLFSCRRDDPRKGIIDVALTDPSTEWTDQKIKNAIFVIELIRILVTGKNQNTNINQTLLGQSDMVPVLFETAMDHVIPSQVRKDCFQAVGDLMLNHDQNRDKFSKCVANVTVLPEHSGLPEQKPPPGTATNSIVALVKTILEKQPYPLRMGALYAFKSYMDGNVDAQVLMAQSLHPTNGTKNGQKLIDSILDLSLSKKDNHRSWFASCIILHSIFDNESAKNIASNAIYLEHGGLNN